MSSFWTSSYFSKWGCRCLVPFGLFFCTAVRWWKCERRLHKSPSSLAGHSSAPVRSRHHSSALQLIPVHLRVIRDVPSPPFFSAERFLAGAAAAHQKKIIFKKKKKSSSISTPLLSLSICVSEQTKHFPDIWILKLHVENWLESVIFFSPHLFQHFPSSLLLLLSWDAFEMNSISCRLRALPPRSSCSACHLEMVSPVIPDTYARARRRCAGEKQQQQQKKGSASKQQNMKKMTPFQIR